MIVNGRCRITSLPFGRECSKRWWVAEKFGTKIQDHNLEIWFQDQSITLECKEKGN